MKINDYVKCDYCGAIERADAAPDEGWKLMEGGEYCAKCWKYGDDCDFETKDGKKWDGFLLEEIKYWEK